MNNLFYNKIIRYAHKYCLNDRKQLVSETDVDECFISSLVENCNKLPQTC